MAECRYSILLIPDVFKGVLYDNYSIKDISEEEAEEKMREGDTGLSLPLHACYVQIADEFQDLFRYTNMDSISCFYPLDDGTAVMLFTGSVLNDSGNYDYALGQTNPFNMDLHPRLKKNIGEGSGEVVREIMNSSVDGKRFIQYYAPLYNDKGELICVVSEALWLSDLIRSIVKGTLIVEGLNALFHLLILLILLHLLNKSVGQPVLMLEKAVTTYAGDKDTDNFVRSLAPMSALENEFAVLSEETAEMAVELRRYADENLALAEEKKHLEGQLQMAVESLRSTGIISLS